MTGGVERPDAVDHRPRGGQHARQRASERSGFINRLQQHHPKMRGLAMRILHDTEAADDALQNAYIKAYQKRETLRDDANAASWLYTIVYRSCIDEHRRRRPTVPFDDNIGDRPDALVPFEQTISQRLGLRDALGHLNPAQRAAIWLVDAEGMTFAEAADVLGVPSGTIGSRVSRARTTLRQLLSDPTDPVSEDRS